MKIGYLVVMVFIKYLVLQHRHYSVFHPTVSRL